jgi:hypothetical protein
MNSRDPAHAVTIAHAMSPAHADSRRDVSCEDLPASENRSGKQHVVFPTSREGKRSGQLRQEPTCTERRRGNSYRRRDNLRRKPCDNWIDVLSRHPDQC